MSNSNVNINSFSKVKQNSGGSGGGSSTIYASVANLGLVEKFTNPRRIWGHLFDGTKDVEGDFFAKGAWTVQSPYTDKSITRFIPGQLNNGLSRWIWRLCNVELHDGIFKLGKSDSTKHLEISQDKIYTDGDLTIKADGDLALEAYSMTQKYEEGHLDLGIKGDLKAGSLFTNNLYDYGAGQIYVGSPLLLDGGLDLNGDLTVKNLYSQTITNDLDIRTKNLTVTGQMTVFDLVIAEISAAGGNLILSAADFRIDDVESGRINVPNEHNFSVCGNGWIDGYYRTKYIYQIAVDDNGQKIDCKWKEFDQIISYTSNVSEDSALEMRSWWTLVLSVEPNVDRYINGEIRPCHRLEIVEAISHPTYTTGGEVATEEEWINPSWGPCNPMTGDNCALLGSHHPDRQNAIILSAYDTIDLHLKAPCIAQYEHIVGFELPEASTYFSRSGNRISGNLVTNSGRNIAEVIDSVIKGRQTYMHQAWSDSEDGELNFTKVKDREYAFVGYASNMTSTDDDLVYTDYIWTPANSQNKLLPTRERLYLSEDDSLYLDVEYLVNNWTSSNFEITAEIFTYGGAVTTRRITDRTNDGKRLRYAGLVQKNWSSVENHSMQYCSATVYLKDGNKILDSRSFQMIMDAGAIVSITDKINARVSDSDGNVNTLVMTAKMLMQRITSLNSSLQFMLNDDSANLRIDAIDGRVNDISITVDGLSAKLDSGIQYDDDWIRQKMAEYDIGIDGIKASLQSISQSAYDDSWIVKKFNDFQVTVDGLSESLRQVETQGYDDSDITEKISNLEHTIDGLKIDVENIKTWGDDTDVEQGQLAVLSNQVYARVIHNMQETGIDITAGKIDLQADNTNVKGTLNIRDSNDSGIIVYDSTETPRINITPGKIGEFDDLVPSVIGYARNTGYTTGSQTFYYTTGDQGIGEISIGTELYLTKFSIILFACNASGETGQPIDATGNVNIELVVKKDGQQIKTESFIVSNPTNHHYTPQNNFTIPISANGRYTICLTATSADTVPSGKRIYGSLSVQYQYASSTYTTLAEDGFVVKSSGDKTFFVGKDGVSIQQGYNLWKFTQNGGLLRGFVRGTSTDSSGQIVTRNLWLHNQNYRQIFQPGTFKYMNVPPIGEYRWCYEIDPQKDYGDCVVMMYAMDDSYRKQETWILLPKTYWQENGQYMSLPAGYTVRVINAMTGDRSALRVSCGYTLSMANAGKNVIWDANMNGNRFAELDGPQAHDEYLWTGYEWISLHDTQ